MADGSAEPSLGMEVAKHLRYFTRCFKSFLPYHYLSNEGNRMALAYFILNGLDLLGALNGHSVEAGRDAAQPVVTAEDRLRIRDWVLAHQHPAGGFCATISSVLAEPGHPIRQDWDSNFQAPAADPMGCAQLSGTVFALQILAMVAEDDAAESAFRGVNRPRTLEWLRTLQRDDGSFGDSRIRLPEKGWHVGGGYDMRYCYLACLVRWMLRGDVQAGDRAWVEDFDTSRLATYILNSQAYDGGLAQSSRHEPHAGYAYCAIGALSLLDRPLEGSLSGTEPSQTVVSGIRDLLKLTYWLASRQYVYRDPPEDDDEDDEDLSFHGQDQEHNTLCLFTSPPQHVGFNGRCSKVADTCYTWWAGATLSNLNRGELLAREPARRFLLEKTAHRIGGFGKCPGSGLIPDIYHSCFGLAALSVLGEPALQPFDTTLAVTTRTAKRIEKAKRGLLDMVQGRSRAAMAVQDVLKLGAQMKEV